MIELVVASGKGGVGKSTVSSSIALVLKEKGMDLVLVDADADAPNLHLIFGVEGWEEVESYRDSWVARIDYDKCTNCGYCYDACTFGAIGKGERYVINEIICEGCLTCSLVCPEKAVSRERVERGIVRVGSTGYGFKLVSARLNPGRPNSGRLVTEEKERAKKLAREDSVIVVDASAGIGCQVVSSLAGANLAILVVEPTPASFSDMKRVHKLTKHFAQPSVLVVNKYDANLEFLPKLEGYARENKMEVIGMIPYDDSVPKSMALLKPVLKAFPDRPASKALKEVGERVYEIISEWDEWAPRHLPKPEPYRPIILKPEGNFYKKRPQDRAR